MKNPIFYLVPILLLIHLFAFPQTRSVVVVYDDSGSMGSGSGSRCNSVSYAIQVMTAFLPEEDLLYIVKMSDYQNPIQINPAHKAQHIESMRNWLCPNQSPTPIGSVHKAISILRANNVNEKLLIVFTDGDFNDFAQPDKDEILSFIADDCSKLLLLNIDNINAEFASWLYNIGVPDIYHSSSNPQSIIDNMERITTSIFTLPESGLSPSCQSASEVKVNSVFPLKRLIVLDQQTATLPCALSDARADSIQFDISQSFTASKDNINSRITHIRNRQNQLSLMPAGEYTITFSNAVDINHITFLPQVALELEAEINGNFKSRQGNNIVLCDYDNEVEVIARILTLDGEPISSALLSEAEMKVIVNQQAQPMVFSDSVFKYRFKADDHSILSISAKHEGYYSFRSNLFSIKVEKCVEITLPSGLEFPKINVNEQNKVVSLDIQPLADGKPVALNNYPDLVLVPGKLGAEKIEIRNEDDKWVLESQMAKCACFAKTGKIPVEIELWSETKNYLIDKTTVYLNIENVPFYKKCLKLILWILGLILTIWYIFGLIKKPRFCRDYKMTYIYKRGRNVSRRESYRFNTNPFMRWFVPYLPECMKVEGITVKASPRKSFVYIDKNSVQNKHDNDRVFLDSQEYTSSLIKKDLRLGQQILFEIRESGGNNNIYRYVSVHED